MLGAMQVLVSFPSWAALSRACAQELSQGGLYIKRDLQAAQFSPLDVVIVTPDDERVTLAAEVVQSVPGQATAVFFKPSSRPQLEELMRKVMEHPDPLPPTDPEILSVDDGEVVPGGNDEEDDDVPFPDQVSVQHQLDAMNVNEKRNAAMHGGRDMRLLLLRDLNKTLHAFVLRNPAITLDEVEAASKMPGLNPDALRTIAQNKDWQRSSNVLRNLVRNPKTPLPDAVALLDKLPIGEVRAIAKSSSVRMAILQAARRKVSS